MPRSSMSPAQILWRHASEGHADECWEWRGARTSQGYGSATMRGRYVSGHRLSWEVHNGLIPEGMWVLHRCDNPPCVNPAHLFLGNRTDNVRDMFSKGRGNPARGDRHALRKNPEKVRGVKNGRALLDEKSVRDIRQRAAAGQTVASLAREYQMSEGALRHITKRRHWAHVPDVSSTTFPIT